MVLVWIDEKDYTRNMIGRRPKCVEKESALWNEKGEYPGKISLDIRMTINLTDGPDRKE